MIWPLKNARTVIGETWTVAGSVIGERWKLLRKAVSPLVSAAPPVAVAVFIGLLITLMGITSGIQVTALLGIGGTLAAVLAVLYAGVQGRSWAISLYFLVVAFTIDAMLRRRGLTDTGMDSQTIFKLLVWGGAFLVGVMNFAHIKRALEAASALRWMLAFALWCLFSTVYSIAPAYTFGGGFAFVALICFVAVAVQTIGPERLALSVIHACGLLTISAVILYIVMPSAAVSLLEGGSIARLAGLTGSPNNLGRAAAIALFFIYCAVRSKQVTLRRPDIIAIIIASVACLVLSWSRTSIIALVLSIGVLMVRRRVLLSVWGAAAVSALLLVLVMADFNWDTLVRVISRRGSLHELTTFTGRTAIWDYTWGAFLKEPLLGYGYGSTKMLLPSGFRTVFGWTTTSAHNMVLQTLVTTGLIGAVPVVAALLLQVRDFFKRPHDLADGIFILVLYSGLFEAGAVGVAPNLLTIIWLICLSIPRGLPPIIPSPLAGEGQGGGEVGRGRVKFHSALVSVMAAALLCMVPVAHAASPEKSGGSPPEKSESVDLVRLFGNPASVDGKFGWSNVSPLTEAGGSFVRIRYPAGSYDPGSMKKRGMPIGGAGFRRKLNLPPSDCMSLSYSVRFAPDFPFTKGGKLPGLGGGIGNTGGKIPNGRDGFSTRFMWRGSGAGEVYAYLPTSREWGTSLGRGDWSFKPGVWNRIQQKVRLNTPGRADGEISVWLNGQPVHVSRGLTFRETDTLKTDLLIFETFFGGNSPDWAPPRETYADFADMTAATCK
ncbi:MAG: O-antigen ligase family protein [Desulfuromonadales bacterium]|nr:MAG: O-antigen ligase family protein [Desulfuromonadales bacterium]